jgi:hypothetical protein
VPSTSGRDGIVSDVAHVQPPRDSNEARSRTPLVVRKAKIDARPYNREDGSGYYDINILGAGGTLTRERTDDGSKAMYQAEDLVFPIACEQANQLCWSYGTEAPR